MPIAAERTADAGHEYDDHHHRGGRLPAPTANQRARIPVE